MAINIYHSKISLEAKQKNQLFFLLKVYKNNKIYYFLLFCCQFKILKLNTLCEIFFILSLISYKQYEDKKERFDKIKIIKLIVLFLLKGLLFILILLYANYKISTQKLKTQIFNSSQIFIISLKFEDFDFLLLFYRMLYLLF